MKQGERGTQGRPPTDLVIARKDNPLEVLRAEMSPAASRLAAIVPRHVDAGRVIELAISNARRDPNLLRCTTASMLISTAQIAALGLEPGTALQQAYLVPRKNRKKIGNKWEDVHEATAIIGYRGFVLLAYEGERITAKTNIVSQNDIFRSVDGLDPKLEHEETDGNPGDVRGAYCVWRFPDGRRDFLYWPVRKLLAHRDRFAPRSSYAKGGGFIENAADRPLTGPWLDNPEAMFQKTVVRMAAKMWPLTSERMRGALTVDDAGEQGRSIAFIPGAKAEDVKGLAMALGERPETFDEGDYADLPEDVPPEKPSEPKREPGQD